MTEPEPVKRDFYLILKRLRDVRAWAGKRDIDPWVFRRALITVFEMDTAAAVERGVKPEKLRSFDEGARREARDFVGRLPG